MHNYLEIDLSILHTAYLEIPYLFGYKTNVFLSKNNPKTLDLSYNLDLDFWDVLEGKKPTL